MYIMESLNSLGTEPLFVSGCRLSNPSTSLKKKKTFHMIKFSELCWMENEKRAKNEIVSELWDLIWQKLFDIYNTDLVVEQGIFFVVRLDEYSLIRIRMSLYKHIINVQPGRALQKFNFGEIRFFVFRRKEWRMYDEILRRCTLFVWNSFRIT